MIIDSRKNTWASALVLRVLADVKPEVEAYFPPEVDQIPLEGVLIYADDSNAVVLLTDAYGRAEGPDSDLLGQAVTIHLNVLTGLVVP